MTLLAASALLCVGEAMAVDVTSLLRGLKTSYGRAVTTSDDSTWYPKRYYEWRVEMLSRQPAIRDIAFDILGAPSRGVQATLAGPPGRVRSGSKVLVTLVLKNVSDQEVQIPFKYTFDNECGLTTLVDGPQGRVPYRWQLDPDLGPCQATTPTPDWSTSHLPLTLRPGETYQLSFDLGEVFDLSKPGRYEVVVAHPLPDVSSASEFDPITVQDYATSNKIAVTVY